MDVISTFEKVSVGSLEGSFDFAEMVVGIAAAAVHSGLVYP